MLSGWFFSATSISDNCRRGLTKAETFCTASSGKSVGGTWLLRRSGPAGVHPACPIWPTAPALWRTRAPGRVDQGHWHAGCTQLTDQRQFRPSGGFDGRQSRLQDTQAAKDLPDANFIVGGLPELPNGSHADVEPRFGYIDSDERISVLILPPSVSIRKLPDLA